MFGYANLLVKNHWFFLVSPIILAGIFSNGLSKFQLEMDISTLYTPLNAKTHVENQNLKIYKAIYDSSHRHSAAEGRTKIYGRDYLLVSIRQLKENNETLKS